MRRTLPSTLLIAALSLSLGACLLLTREQLQSLRLFFQLDETVPAGEMVEAYSSVYPAGLELKGSFVNIIGSLTPATGTALPGSVKVRVVATDTTTGSAYHRLNLTLRIDPDGGFSAVKKFGKNLRAETLHTVFVEPVGSPVAAGSRIALCIEVIRRRADASPRASCAPGGSGTGGGRVVTVRVLDNAFDPRSVTIQPGDTVRWVHEGSDPSHTTTAADGTWDSGLAFDVRGAIFERTFPRSEDGETFRYYCVSHQACCSMQGSVRVGADAPDPGDNY